MVKFGQTVIFKENLQNLADEVKKSEWTENKYYKSATCVEVKPKFDLKKCEINNKDKDEAVQTLVTKLKANKDVLDKMSSVYFNTNLSQDGKFQEFKKELISGYFDDRVLTKKRNYVILTKALTNFRNVNYSDLEELNGIGLEEISKFKNSKLLNIIKKYKINFLIKDEYKCLNQIERNNLKKFLEAEEKKVLASQNSNVNNINDFCFDFTNKSNLTNVSNVKNANNSESINNANNPQSFPVDNFNLLKSISPERKQNDLKHNDSSDLMVSRLVLFEEFRNLVKNFSLSDEQIMNYFKVTEDIVKAAEIYFKDLYRANTLRVIFIFPNNAQQIKEFSLIDSPEDLFMFIFSMNPDANEPKLYKADGSQIVIDPRNDRFIGGLHLPQNAILHVKF
jgi:hypothetical protein